MNKESLEFAANVTAATGVIVTVLAIIFNNEWWLEFAGSIFLYLFILCFVSAIYESWYNK